MSGSILLLGGRSPRCSLQQLGQSDGPDLPPDPDFLHAGLGRSIGIGPGGRPLCRVAGRPHDQGHRPGFHAATGYTFNGTSGDSGSLANEIKGKTVVGDVFISANPSKNTGLEGASNGNWVSWYALFATSPLVLGYNPNSKFAQDLKTEPWYEVLAKPGILVGRTDPATDPKGVLDGHRPGGRGHDLQPAGAQAPGNRVLQRLPREHPGRPAPSRATRRRLLLRGGSGRRQYRHRSPDRRPEPWRPSTPSPCSTTRRTWPGPTPSSSTCSALRGRPR